MKKPAILIVFVLFFVLIFSISCVDDDVTDTQNRELSNDSFLGILDIDINHLLNYEDQLIPSYINRDNTINNQITDEGATLGRVLFYDKNLSINNSIACASCHKQQIAFTDDAIHSEGVGGFTTRHSMRLVNSRFSDEFKFFWDERADDLEEQTTMPIKDHLEMGFSGDSNNPDFSSLIEKLQSIDYYSTLFTLAYGDETITEIRMQDALAQFIRSIQSFDTKYDEGRRQVNNNNQNFPNFTEQENIGKNLFQAPPQFTNTGLRIGGGLGCGGCHQAPEFSIDPNSRSNAVIGIGPEGTSTGTDLTNTRSPSIRDFLSKDGTINGNFAMHNSQFISLNEVLNHYNAIPDFDSPLFNQAVDNRLRPSGIPQQLNLTDDERDAVIAFVQTLTGEDVYTNEKWSDPFF